MHRIGLVSTNCRNEISAVTDRVFVAKTPEVFTCDADGNMTSDGRFTYTWNDENRMVSASNAEVVVTYAYDHRGRMIRKTISRGEAEPQSIEYLWDGWNIIRETRVTGLASHVSGLASNVTYNLWGLDLDGTMQGAGGVGGLLAVIRNGETYIPTYDANGNISEYLSASDGTVAAHYDYSPFGEQLISSGPLASAFTHRFSTKPWCPVTGFCEYQMRKYRPDIGRWMSRDPIGENGGENLHAFCGNDLGLVDYLGLTVDVSNFHNLGSLRRQDYNKAYNTYAVGGTENYLDLIQYKGKSGRTVQKHESLHYSYALSAAKKLDEQVHKVIDGKCDSHACITAKRGFLLAVWNYFDQKRNYNSTQLDMSDYCGDTSELQGKINQLTMELEALRSRLRGIREKIERECSK